MATNTTKTMEANSKTLGKDGEPIVEEKDLVHKTPSELQAQEEQALQDAHNKAEAEGHSPGKFHVEHLSAQEAIDAAEAPSVPFDKLYLDKPVVGNRNDTAEPKKIRDEPYPAPVESVNVRPNKKAKK